MRIHDDEREIDDALVRSLVDEQFPTWSDLTLERAGDGTVNVIYRLGTGVLDWGGAGVGDPALDMMAAWKLVASEERERFRALLDVDDATWLRAKGWAVSQALIALGYYTLENYPPLVHEARSWLAELRSG